MIELLHQQVSLKIYLLPMSTYRVLRCYRPRISFSRTTFLGLFEPLAILGNVPSCELSLMVGAQFQALRACVCRAPPCWTARFTSIADGTGELWNTSGMGRGTSGVVFFPFFLLCRIVEPSTSSIIMWCELSTKSFLVFTVEPASLRAVDLFI